VIVKYTAKMGKLPFPLTKPTWPSSLPRPNPKRHVGVDFETAWARRYPARLFRAVYTDFVAGPLSKAVAPSTIVGAERLDRMDGPLIFAANHNSHADTSVLIAAIPSKFRHRLVVAAASDYFFDSTIKATTMALILGAIPIERAKVSRRSAQTAIDLANDGWSVVIYPEGGRSADGWMGEFKSGAAFVAQRSGATVIPVFIEGTSRVLPKNPIESEVAPGGSGSESQGVSRLRRHPVSILFGRPLVASADEDVRAFSSRIEEAVIELGREVATDYYQARRTKDRSLTHGPSAGPWQRSWARPQAISVSERSLRDRWPFLRRPN
jgi:1-acyl-sn-glycerol-3-phosphate acyltransferase